MKRLFGCIVWLLSVDKTIGELYNSPGQIVSQLYVCDLHLTFWIQVGHIVVSGPYPAGPSPLRPCVAPNVSATQINLFQSKHTHQHHLRAVCHPRGPKRFIGLGPGKRVPLHSPVVVTRRYPAGGSAANSRRRRANRFVRHIPVAN